MTLVKVISNKKNKANYAQCKFHFMLQKSFSIKGIKSFVQFSEYKQVEQVHQRRN